ncbi:MAG: hypothetical protein KIT18_11500, partial [Burkholderiales bacterium]|nr:hypothetical protein [Burkholderiales bacterium]
MKHGRPAITVCSTVFLKLGRAQATALGYPGLPIAAIPHPFSNRSREEIHGLAEQCASEIVRLLCTPAVADGRQQAAALRPSAMQAARVEVPGDLREFNRLCMERRWGDGLPLYPPTLEAVEAMCRHTRHARGDIVARVAPAFGAATVERIAINAVMAGCEPMYLPVLIAAVEAVATPRFNLQGVQTTTDPVAVWLIINGPVVGRLGINSGAGCLGQGTWANATLGRALRLILQNVGGALPGEM